MSEAQCFACSGVRCAIGPTARAIRILPVSKARIAWYDRGMSTLPWRPSRPATIVIGILTVAPIVYFIFFITFMFFAFASINVDGGKGWAT
jgi:hypothetical protein